MKKLAVLIIVLAFCITGCGYYYTVKKGDTIYSISQKHGVDQQQLMNENNITDPTKLQIGQQLKIPRSKMTAGTKPSNNTYAKKGDKDKDRQNAIDKIRKGSADNNTGTKHATWNFIWPVKGGTVTGSFGKGSDGRINDGIDISAAEGTPIVAVADGEVIFSSDKFPAYGNMIVVKHDSQLVTLYAYNRRNLVLTGTKVRKGQTIAEVGATGRAKTPMVHFEVRKVKTPVDPMKYLPPQ